MTKIKKPAFHNAPPQGLPDGAPPEAVRAEFAKRLQTAMVAKGWTQSELARRAALHMPDKKFGRDNVSNYIRGTTMPGPANLNALAKVLGMAAKELVPSRGLPSVDDRMPPPLDVKELSDGRAWLRVNQAVDWNTAMQVVALLKRAAA